MCKRAKNWENDFVEESKKHFKNLELIVYQSIPPSFLPPMSEMCRLSK